MKKNLSKLVLVTMFSFLILFPMISNAQPSSDAGGFLATIQSLLNSVVPVLISLGIVYLVWGIVQYMIGDSEEAKTKGKERVIFGIVGLAIIISVWGLVSIVTRTFGLGGSAPTREELQNLLPR
jgi:mannose/fructose/N-acetylgalactosamine-specific phosphotransferase system component IID